MDDRLTLDRWLALTDVDRATAIATASDPDTTLVRLGDECERLAATQVAAAIQAVEQLLSHAPTRGRACTRLFRAMTTALAYAGRPQESLIAAESAVSAARHSGLPVDAARAHVASLHPLTKLGRIDEALERGAEARAALLAAGEAKLAARADLNLGNIRKSVGHVTEALEHLERARSVLADEPAMVAHAENTLGETHLLRDDFEAARTSFEAAARHFIAVGQHFAAAIVDGNLADLAGREGRLQDALRHFERARGTLERDAASDHVARLLAEEAEVLAALGSPTEALRGLDHALARLDAMGPTTESARARLARARVLASFGRLDEAKTDADVAAANAQRRGDRWLARLASLLVAEVLIASDPARAAELASGIADDAEARPLDRVVARHHLARALLASGDRARAAAELDAALSGAREVGHAPITVDLLVTRAATTNDAAAAIRDLEEAVDLIEHVRTTLSAQRLRATWTSTRLGAFEALALAQLARGTDAGAALAFDAAERSKARSLLDLVQRVVDRQEARGAIERRHDESRQVREQFDRLRQRVTALYSRWEAEGTPGARHVAVSGPSLRRSVRAEEEALDRLADRLATIEGHRSLWAPPLRLAEVQARLAADETLLEYFAAEGELMAFAVTRDRLRVIRKLARVDDIAALASSALFQMRRATRARDRDPSSFLVAARAPLARLYDTLIRPVESELARATALVVVPHGPLHGVPFHALFDQARGSYLTDRVAVRCAPSATLGHVEHRARSPRADRDRRTLVVGVSDSAAPAIAAEAAAVGRAWPHACLLVGADATASRVLAECERADVIHLACHGRFSESLPNASGLKLADRWISIREITELSLRADLVILAGCETGRAALQPGDEAVGLPRSFIAAGASSVLVSLWPVRDDEALRFMTDLHERLASVRGSQTGVASVVRETMRARRDSVGSTAVHPALWGAFSLVGADPGAPCTSDAHGAPPALAKPAGKYES